MRIGFVGQGWIGKHYADDFEVRGYEVVRYAKEAPYVENKERIASCDMVFIAVPTPTTPEGFNSSIVRAVLPLVGAGNIAVIKSTLLPGTTEELQAAFPHIFVLHSPEFLVESTAAYDAAHPSRNIVGIPIESEAYRAKAHEVLRVLPIAPYSQVLSACDAELLKYAGNCFLYTKVLYMNLLYDLTQRLGGDWSALREALVADPRIGASHTEPVHKSGRGAGGNCFIKDFEAFRSIYAAKVGDTLGDDMLNALSLKNNDLLLRSHKDIELLRGVFGDTLGDNHAQ